MFCYYRIKIAAACVQGITEGKYLRLNWCVGTGTNAVRGVCRLRFMYSYGLRGSYLYQLCKQVKYGVVNSSTALNDKSAGASRDCLRQLQLLLADENGIKLSNTQLAAMQIPNFVESLNCYGWLEFYFDMVGDAIPNSTEIHLEPTWVADIYEEYVINMNMASFKTLGPAQFGEIWRNCFPHVYSGI